VAVRFLESSELSEVLTRTGLCRRSGHQPSRLKSRHLKEVGDRDALVDRIGGMKSTGTLQCYHWIALLMVSPQARRQAGFRASGSIEHSILLRTAATVIEQERAVMDVSDIAVCVLSPLPCGGSWHPLPWQLLLKSVAAPGQPGWDSVSALDHCSQLFCCCLSSRNCPGEPRAGRPVDPLSILRRIVLLLPLRFSLLRVGLLLRLHGSFTAFGSAAGESMSSLIECAVLVAGPRHSYLSSRSGGTITNPSGMHCAASTPSFILSNTASSRR